MFSFFSRYNPGVELLDHMIVLFLVFWDTSIQFCIVAAPIYITTNSVQGFPFLHILSNICYLWSLRWEPFWQMWGDISLWFWFAFLWCLVMLSIFSCACWPSVYLLWKNVYSGLLPIFKSDCLFFRYWIVWALYIVCTLTLIIIHILQIFSPIQ